VLGTEIKNRYHIFDFAVAYQLNSRWTLNASIPITKNYRNQLYSPTGIVDFVSQGDATVGFKRWMFRAPTESLRNVSLGAALKLPTGRYNQMYDAVRSGQQIRATADQSVQAGDGGTGVALDINAYTPFAFNSWAFVQGLYLLNPRDTNGVSTFRGGSGEGVMSVADQYLLRSGVTKLLPKARSMAWSMGIRLEGVPVRDLIGKSNGFRRPGYALSIDPGFMMSRWGNTFMVSVPYAVKRDRRRSVPDIARSATAHGDAAFADYSIIIGYSRRF
jgi:hypothetical protein